MAASFSDFCVMANNDLLAPRFVFFPKHEPVFTFRHGFDVDARELYSKVTEISCKVDPS